MSLPGACSLSGAAQGEPNGFPEFLETVMTMSMLGLQVQSCAVLRSLDQLEDAA